jgi:hypothetical protein
MPSTWDSVPTSERAPGPPREQGWLGRRRGGWAAGAREAVRRQIELWTAPPPSVKINAAGAKKTFQPSGPEPRI